MILKMASSGMMSSQMNPVMLFTQCLLVTNFFRFNSSMGKEVVLNLEYLIACWEGEKADTMVLELDGLETPILVQKNFGEFVEENFTYYDER